jgi:hypothetical protein
VAEPQPASSHAPNRGLADRKGETTWFFDDNLQFTTDWFSAAWKVVQEHPEVGFLAGNLIPDWGDVVFPEWFSIDAAGHDGHVCLSARYDLGPSGLMSQNLGTLEVCLRGLLGGSPAITFCWFCGVRYVYGS